MAASSTSRRFEYRKAEYEYEYESRRFQSKAFSGRGGVAVLRGWSIRATSAPGPPANPLVRPQVPVFRFALWVDRRLLVYSRSGTTFHGDFRSEQGGFSDGSL